MDIEILHEMRAQAQTAAIKTLTEAVVSIAVSMQKITNVKLYIC